MNLPLTGGCLCGAVRYAITAPPLKALNCHCRSCQKALGAAYWPLYLVAAEALEISGNCSEYASTAASGNSVRRCFCPTCGTLLFNRYSGMSKRTVSAVTLDDPSVFQAEADVWVGDAQPWDIMDPNIPKFAGNPVRS